MRLAMIMAKVDADDSVYGANIAWIKSLANRVEHLTVIGMSIGNYTLPENVTVFSMGKEKGASKFKRFLVLQRIMFPLLILKKVDGVFIHQGQIWGPLIFYSKLRNIPVILFKAHGSLPQTVKNFLPFFNFVTTTTDETFPIETEKKISVGQGIDTAKFAPKGAPPQDRVVTSVGRITALKGYEVLIDAIGILNKSNETPTYLRIYGEAYSTHDQSHFVKLQQQIKSLNLSETVTLEGVVPNDLMPEILNATDLYVNPSTGASALDKSVLEAMACELPVISCNPKFRAFFGNDVSLLYCPPNDAPLLAAKIDQVFALDLKKRLKIGSNLRAFVVRDHDVNQLMDRIVKIFNSFQSKDGEGK